MERQQPWAKLVRDDAGQVVAALSLVDHCLDVGAAAEAILPAWLPWLSAAAGRTLTAQDVARLIALIALHDLGKANRGFQARIDPRDKNHVGHTGPVAALLKHSALKRGAAAQAINGFVAAWGARLHLAAVMAHHGRPLVEFARDDMERKPWTKHARHWQPAGDHDPAVDVLTLIDAVRARWPLAWEEGPKLSDAPRFVALFAGLVTLADWLGSDTRRFPVEGPHGDARAVMRTAQARDAAAARGFLPLPTPALDFATALQFPPRGFQQDAAAPDLGAVALIEAETGSGKTEAALWRWLELRRRGLVDGLFFALPTRSAAVQLHARVNIFLKRVWGPDAPEAVLAVPGYLRSGDAIGQALPDYQVRWDRGEAGESDDARWAAERANRFLAARVAVGTIDQALLGTLKVKHALFRAGVLARSLLVVDEVHASDAYMAALLERLFDHHVAIGGHALLLSATLGAAARARLLKTPMPSLAEAETVPYPALSGLAAAPRGVAGPPASDKHVTIETAGSIEDADAIAERAVEAARAGAAVLVVRNSVSGAIAVAQAVAARAPDLAFRIDNVPTVHHGRFARADRELLDDAVTIAFGKGRTAGGRVLVGTQTLEQSLDIDADYLITDLAPMDVLLQRIGRLHRHQRDDRGAFAAARVLVLRPAERDLTALLGRSSSCHGLGGQPQRSPYPDLLQLEATLRLIEATPAIAIPRDNRRLVERALNPDALDAVARDGGTAWLNRKAETQGHVTGERETARLVALDLSQPFDTLLFSDAAAQAATRLGARDLLVDLPEPLPGPFGRKVDRIAIPHWMAPTSPVPELERLDDHHFRLGDRRYVYDQWGLRLVA